MKISKVKRNNQKRVKFSKKTKAKNESHQPKKPIKKVNKNQVPVPNTQQVPSEDEDEDYLDLFDSEELDYLQKSVANNSKLQNILKSSDKKSTGKAETGIEEKYEKNILRSIDAEKAGKEVRYLLPIKTAEGHLEKRVVEESEIEDEGDEDEEEEGEEQEETEGYTESQPMEIETEPVSVAKLLAFRQEVLNTRKLAIATLCNGLLENPEQNKRNFSALLEFMSDTSPETFVTVRKLATASLLEVFKDVLPSYSILKIKQDGVKLKKDTLELQNYEATLLKNYKQYLQKLEKMANALRRKFVPSHEKGSKIEQETQLGMLAVNCMCDLLVTHPYFNFSNNIANFLVPLLDSKHENVRKTIASSINQIFKEDKRYELTLQIVRRINHHIKQRKHTVHTEVLGVLLSLRIKEVNLDQEKDEESKQKKLKSHKQNILALSKRERKRDKRLKEVEAEMLETQAEESKKNQQKLFTEITSVVFTIYFRILKQAPNSKILSVCLEGLAKFAHCINLEFYQDLVNVLNSLLEDENLHLRERLNSISTVFNILSGQGTILNIDPHSFYCHLYKNMYNVHAGKTSGEAAVLLKILDQALISRQKSLPLPTLVAFVKRIATVATSLEHHSALGLLAVIKTILQVGKGAHVLLDTDNNVGDGVFLAELDEPEYCNAHCSALWEIVALQRHYHGTVQNFAKHISWNLPTKGEGSVAPQLSKLRPVEIYNEFDPTNVAFKPAISAPKKAVPKMTSSSYYFVNPKFQEFVDSKCSNDSLEGATNWNFKF